MGRGGEPHHQVPAQDLGSLDQNIQLIRAPLFHVSHRFDDVSHCWESSGIHMLASTNTVVFFFVVFLRLKLWMCVCGREVGVCLGWVGRKTFFYLSDC